MDVKELIKNVTTASSAPAGQIKEEMRIELLAACNKLKGALETPLDLTIRVIFGVETLWPSRIEQDRLLTCGGMGSLTKLLHFGWQ